MMKILRGYMFASLVEAHSTQLKGHTSAFVLSLAN